MLDSLRSLVDLGTDAPGLTPTDAKHVRVTNVASLVLALTLASWVPLNLQAGVPWNAAENALVAMLYLGGPLWNRACRPRLASMWSLALAHVQLAWALYWFGVPSGTHYFFPSLILAAYAMLPAALRGLAHANAVLVVLQMAAIAAMADQLPARVVLMDLGTQSIVNAAVATGVLAILAGTVMVSVDLAEAALEDARDRADRLLLNVLPPSIAERLKQEGRTEPIADRYDEVTVLFADLAGFTPLSERLSAERTVALLNEVFTAFDAMCDRAGVEKIRTIGDGYMAVCGAPDPCEDHALVLTRVALEMVAYMETQPTGEPLEVRIGLNSGEAVAAIVGTSRFHYDLWGDAVNVAARMESLGAPGRVHIARGTWERIKDTIPCTSRGTLEVKGKGPMETWFVGEV